MLLDVITPDMDGYQVLEEMKSDEVLRHLPVVMISARGDLEGMVRCLELGAEDYLAKPFNPVLLRARIGASLARKQQHDRERFHVEQLRAAQEQSEALLLNVLPKAIADRLKLGESAIADYFPAVTVLFADLVGFTAYAARLAPATVVERLNEMFSAFDQLAERHGVEKIKTIGDAYLAVGGLPVPRADHADAIAELALDMQIEVDRFNQRNGENIVIRTGIHSGPVVAGIIGTKKLTYDLRGAASPGGTRGSCSAYSSGTRGSPSGTRESSCQRARVGSEKEMRLGEGGLVLWEEQPGLSRVTGTVEAGPQPRHCRRPASRRPAPRAPARRIVER